MHKSIFNKEQPFNKLLEEKFKWTDKEDETTSKFDSLSNHVAASKDTISLLCKKVKQLKLFIEATNKNA